MEKMAIKNIVVEFADSRSFYPLHPHYRFRFHWYPRIDRNRNKGMAILHGHYCVDVFAFLSILLCQNEIFVEKLQKIQCL